MSIVSGGVNPEIVNNLRPSGNSLIRIQSMKAFKMMLNAKWLEP
jgi:hypothetical protein